MSEKIDDGGPACHVACVPKQSLVSYPHEELQMVFSTCCTQAGATSPLQAALPLSADARQREAPQQSGAGIRRAGEHGPTRLDLRGVPAANELARGRWTSNRCDLAARSRRNDATPLPWLQRPPRCHSGGLVLQTPSRTLAVLPLRDRAESLEISDRSNDSEGAQGMVPQVLCRSAPTMGGKESRACQRQTA